MADNNRFEQWELEGSLDAAMRANAIWKQTLAEYEAPPIDEAKDEELREMDRAEEGALPRLERLTGGSASARVRRRRTAHDRRSGQERT